MFCLVIYWVIYIFFILVYELHVCQSIPKLSMTHILPDVLKNKHWDCPVLQAAKHELYWSIRA